MTTRDFIQGLKETGLGCLTIIIGCFGLAAVIKLFEKFFSSFGLHREAEWAILAGLAIFLGAIVVWILRVIGRMMIKFVKSLK